MTKAQYDFLKWRSVSGVTLKDAQKIGFKTAKAAKEAVSEMKRKQEERQEVKRELRKLEQEKSDAVSKYFMKRAKQAVHLLDIYPAHGSINYQIGNTFCIGLFTDTEWVKYGSHDYPHTVYDYIVTIPAGGIRFETVDGILTAYRTERNISGVRVLNGWMLKRGRGYEIKSFPCFAVIAGNHAAHGETLNSAMKSLRKKIKIAERNAEPLTMDSVMTAAKYQRMTGACDAGTNAWIESHGFTRNTRMTVRELLEVLEPYEYGYSRLKAAVKI